MLLNRGALDGVRILGPLTSGFMVRNQLPGGADLESFGRPMNAESPLAGVGQGLGMSMVLDPVRVGYLTSAGEFGWGGAAAPPFLAPPPLAPPPVVPPHPLPPPPPPP